MRIWQIVAALAVVTLVGASWAWACNPWLHAAALAPGGSTEATPSTTSTGPSVTIHTFQFSPTPLEVQAGTRVTWMNQDDITHTITSGVPGKQDGRFDSRWMDRDQRSATPSLSQAPTPITATDTSQCVGKST